VEVYVQSADDEGKIVDGYQEEGITYLHPKITAEQAQEGAEAFLDSMGLTGYNLEKTEIGRIIHGPSYTTLTEGYKCTFRHTFDYCAESTFFGSDGVFKFEEDAAYSIPWEQESLQIYIDENGVQDISWFNPMKVIGIEKANVALLPFEQIQEKVRDYIRFGGAWLAQQRGGYDCTVDRITLTLALQRIANNNEEALLVPVWSVRYAHTMAIKNGGWFGYDGFVLSAIDGSRMEQFSG
jgi:hypothetical protein